MPDKQHTWGQFATPADVADLLLGFSLRRPQDRVLDPSCGQGALLERAGRWQQWLATSARDVRPDQLWGVELEAETAVSAQTTLPHAHILQQNFFTLSPDTLPSFDALIGNPPYTRAAWIAALPTAEGTQLAFDWAAHTGTPAPQTLIPAPLWQQMNHRAGLYTYFFLHSLDFLREGGRLAFVVPNGWLDVAYGLSLKHFLLDHFKLIALVESGVERWFDQAKVNACLVVLEKSSLVEQLAQNQVRLVWLKRPLADLIALPLLDYRRPQRLETLVTRLLPGQSRQTADYDVRVLPQADLQPAAKWGQTLRAPVGYGRRLSQPDLHPLHTWATIQRGYTSGANEFFYLDPETVARWGIEPAFRQPLLKSLRGLPHLRLTLAHCRHELLAIPPTADLPQTAVSAYLAWGEQQGYAQRPTCAARQPWYSLPPQPSPGGQIVLPKGIWRRHTAPLLDISPDTPLSLDQQLYQVTVSASVPTLAVAALLNSAWFMLQCELQGRVNFGAGVLWLATYELGQIRLPHPRTLTMGQVDELTSLFNQLAARPCQEIETELDQPDRQALDTAVFDWLHLTAADRTAVYDHLRQHVQTRRRRALPG